MATDFLKYSQPTSTTVQALEYLDRFFSEQSWEDGLAFEDELHECDLDYSLDSLNRIDALIDRIRARFAPDPHSFLRDPKNYNFIILLAFYCGEVAGRARQQATVWYEYPQYIQRNPMLESIYPPVFWNALVCDFEDAEGNSNVLFPLVGIFDVLFSEFPEKSVYFSTTAFLPNDINSELSLSAPPAQSLKFSGISALRNTPVEHLAYLQILPPQFLAGHPLHIQMYNMGMLYQKGRVVWASLVQANNMLFEEGNYASCPAEVIYDPSGRTDPYSLRMVAKRLFALKGTQPNDPAAAAYAAHITNERSSMFKEVPKTITHLPLRVASIFIWRPHLPDGMLSMSLFPILIADDTPAVTVLPARYWQHTEHYQNWCGSLETENHYENVEGSQKQIVKQETTAAFAVLLEESSDFWQGYSELLYPQPYEIPDLGANICGQTESVSMITNDDNKLFIKRCGMDSKADYRRYLEDLPDESYIQNCIMQLKEKQPYINHAVNVQKYARLRVFDYGSLLSDLDNNDYNQQLKQSALPKIAQAIQRSNLTKFQKIKLIRYLIRQASKGDRDIIINERKPNDPDIVTRDSNSNSTTAMLYLAYLYLSGKFVQQSIREGAAWARYASGLGDWRGTQLLAELLLDVPKAAQEIWGEQANRESSELGFTLIDYPERLVEMDKQVKAYLQYQPAILEVVRNQLSHATEQGHPLAASRCRQLIETQILPPSIPEARLYNARTWIMDYFNQQEKTSPFDRSDAPFELGKVSSDKKYVSMALQWGVIALIVYGAVAFLSGNDDNHDAQVVDTSSNTPTASSVDQNLVNNTQVNAGNQSQPSSQTKDLANKLQETVRNINQKLPVAFRLDPSIQVTDIKQKGSSVIVDLRLSQEVMMSIQNGQALFCSEQLFKDIRQANISMILAVNRPNGEHFYDIGFSPSDCR